MTGMVAGYRTLFRGTAGPDPARPQPVADWRELIPYGGLVGDPGAPIRVVEFADFQCPACARVGPLFQRGRAEGVLPFQVAVLPLPLTAPYPYAFVAAVAAVCAGRQGRFASFHDSLYARQSEIGQRTWNAFARDAAVPSIDAFESCLQDSTVAYTVTRAIGKATQLGVMSTPTFIVDGLLYPPATPAEEVLSVLARSPGL